MTDIYQQLHHEFYVDGWIALIFNLKDLKRLSKYKDTLEALQIATTLYAKEFTVKNDSDNDDTSSLINSHDVSVWL